MFEVQCLLYEFCYLAENFALSVFEFFNRIGQMQTVGIIKNDSRRSRYCSTFIRYFFFRLDNPIRPIRPEPKSQTAAGIGTGVTTAKPQGPFVV